MSDHPPILFVHGMFMKSSSWSGWERFFAARGHETHAPDWPHRDGTPAQLREAPPRYVVDIESGRTRDFGDFLSDSYGTLTSLVSIARFLWLTVKHRDLYEPGLVGADPSLRPRFSDYIRGRGIDPVAHLFRPVFCSLGYGYFEEIPALYVLKFLDRSKIIIVLKSALGIEQSWPRVFTTGFQSLWQAVADGVADVWDSNALARILDAESGDRYDTRVCVLGHLQQGGRPSPQDRLTAARLADAAAAHALHGEGAVVTGLRGTSVVARPIDEVMALADRAHRRPRAPRQAGVVAVSPAMMLPGAMREQARASR